MAHPPRPRCGPRRTPPISGVGSDSDHPSAHQGTSVPHHPRSVRALGAAAALLIAAGLTSCSGSDDEAGPDDGEVTEVGTGDAYAATIRRTTDGVPHITGDTLPDAAFGQGYASGEDRTCDLADQVVKVRGERARWFGPGDETCRATVAGWLRGVDPAGYAAAYRAFAEGDDVYADRIGAIRCPLLVLTGDGDANSTPAMAGAMAAMAGRGRAVVIAAHRHMVNLTAPDRVTAEMRTWLQEPEGQA